MRLKDIEKRNEATLQAIRERGNISDIRALPYYGYYEVDIFECPTFTMFTNNDCPRASDILYRRTFEPHSMKIWCRLARTASSILDIGAHVGVYSLAAAALRKDIAIHAFEPNPYAFARLRMHKMVNGFDNIQEHRFAVSDRKEVTQFGWVKKDGLPISSGGGVRGHQEKTGIERVLAYTALIDGTGLAPTLGKHPLVKIDVEGHEVNAFRGMREVLALKPDIILETFDLGACNAINEIIRPLGYRAYRIREDQGVIELQDQLAPADISGNDFNQLLTTRPKEEILNCLK